MSLVETMLFSMEVIGGYPIRFYGKDRIPG